MEELLLITRVFQYQYVRCDQRDIAAVPTLNIDALCIQNDPDIPVTAPFRKYVTDVL